MIPAKYVQGPRLTCPHCGTVDDTEVCEEYAEVLLAFTGEQLPPIRTSRECTCKHCRRRILPVHADNPEDGD